MIKEELPLFRAKLPGLYTGGGTGPGVGPGSYNLTSNLSKPIHGEAPFGITSERFYSHHGTAVPGVGTYDIITNDYRRGDITVVPFFSSLDRFFCPRADEVPGPGAYPHDGNKWGRCGRSHAMGAACSKGAENSFSIGPGSYDPNYGSGRRANSRAAHFGGYSGRDAPRFNDIPGPGHYDIAAPDNSLYNNKPSSMFSTKTLRSTFGGDSVNPGPGSYNLPSYFQSLDEYRVANPESFSAFGSSAPLHAPGPTDSPGPGAYTGDIAPRRPKAPPKTKKACTFGSGTGRNRMPPGTNIGPGAYEPTKPNKLQKYQLASVPFRSQSPRFPSSKSTEVEGIFEPRRPVVRVPLRIHPPRPRDSAINVAAKMSSRKVPLDPVYNVNYDWPKPTCTSGSYFGTAPRFEKKDSKTSIPGPGQYDISEKPSLGGGGSLNGTWGTDGRFTSGNEVGNPGPGHYRYESTFYKKSFNSTIGSSEKM
ncbi:hypothetical protein, conserved [Trypanosoma cruzi]|uniref:Sperm-tail PG-rich repeat n=1 Tax=Trypanosoma cruzi (strain CL Brener) TaxID=353153 RepID=Q4E4S4_TRYCC|nr:hypothetical protein, conserved [Trypanosoma cruzi]EAN99776.1 hypothetical protein, conserved [Trypanosoma cruzi]|eukprot:XP_821627.1 hypothetical protein [Trypanosoma cruzi strain CL Brener]